MAGISCCCSLPPSACKTCTNLHPELLHEKDDRLHSLAYPQTGWICPICNCGVSPDLNQCPCQLYKVTC
jgi:hypothetical protein